MRRAGAQNDGDQAGPPPDRLRRIRWILAAVLVVGAGLLAGTYLMQPKPAELTVPRVSLRVRETAHGFVLTRSEGGRTIFRLKAALATQMQSGEHTILQQVALVVFDRDGVHADRISGERFQYDPASGNVVAVGEVHIALEGRGAADDAAGENAGGARQMTAPPAALDGRSGQQASPIEVTARRLRFNTKSGAAEVFGGLDFHYWNAVGHADAARLEAGTNELVMTGNVRLHWAPPGRPPLEVRAGEAILDKVARTITLAGGGTAGGGTEPLVTMGARRLTARRLVLRLGADDVVRAAQAVGAVKAEARENGRMVRVTCQSVRLRFRPAAAEARRGPLRQPGVRVAKMVLDGNVMADVMQAGRGEDRLKAALVTVDFTGRNEPAQAQAEQATAWVRGLQGYGERGAGNGVGGTGHAWRTSGVARRRSGPGAPALASQRLAQGGEAEVAAPELRFIFGPGTRTGQTALRQAETEGRGAVRYTPAGGQGTVKIAANQFTVTLNATQQIETGRADGQVEWNQAAAGSQAARKGTAGSAEAWINPKTRRVERLIESGGVRVAIAPSQGHGGARQGLGTGAAWGLGTAGGGVAITGGRLVWDGATGVARLTPIKGKVIAASASGRLEAAEMTLTPVEMTASGGVTGVWGMGGGPWAGVAGEAGTTTGPRKTGPAPEREGAGKAGDTGARSHGERGAAGLLEPGLKGGNGPVNLTAAKLTLSRDGERGVFSGAVRVWQGSSMLRAATLRFNRTRGTVTASGPGGDGVRTAFVSVRGGRTAAGRTQLAEAPRGSGGRGKKAAEGRSKTVTPEAPRPVAVEVAAPVLHLWRDRELAEYSGGVVVDAGETKLTCRFLKIEWAGGGGRLARVVAGGGVRLRQPGRRAEGETAVYDARRRLVTLRGGSPSIYDAELGLLAGGALTFSPVDDTIRVESGAHTRTFAAYQVRH